MTAPAATLEPALSPSADTGKQALAVPEDGLIIIPLRNGVLFPGMVLPVTIGRAASIRAVKYALHAERPVGIVLQKHPDVESPGAGDLHRVGTIATILRHVVLPDHNTVLVCQGEQRFRITSHVEGYPFPVVHFAPIAEPTRIDSPIEARCMRLRECALEMLEMQPQPSPELAEAVRKISTPGALADFVTGILDIPASDRQQVLEAEPLAARLDIVIHHLLKRLETLRILHEIEEQTQASVNAQQREYILREQMKSIQKKLGQEDDGNAELDQLAEAITRAGLPEEAATQAAHELKRLRHMSDMSAEYSMVRSYLDWLIELPWQLHPAPAIDLGEARRLLDAEHYGLTAVKRRIVEFLAVYKLNPEGHAPMLCFVGPPGVGKTSLGQSIARALGRPFVRASLGGMHDEAEIRGHRRTYVGALPGSILQAIKKAGQRDCVLMLDEIDKIGHGGLQGDPAAALLEVLDPEQNASFRDNYLGLPFDLSRVVFITTANVPDTIPPALADRMETIELPGYTQEEKQEIARRHLLGRQRTQHGLQPEQLTVSDAALQAIIDGYTREAGVRALERELATLCRHAALCIAEGQAAAVTFEPDDLPAILGPRRFEHEVALRTSLPGVATGLAWTPGGGDILFIEASRMDGDGELILTGQLGEVMRESAQAALTLVKMRAATLGIDPATFTRSNVHVHIPAGAIPKDGPSAGVPLFIALASLFADRCVRGDTAMTGEISLRGLVLPVGGLQEKLLAARRAGVARVILPARNRKDLAELPAELRAQLELIFVDGVDQAVDACMGPVSISQ